MGYFPDTVAAKLSGAAVRLARLVELDFADQAGRYWEGGFGSLVTADGKTWLGTGELGSISDIPSALGGTAPQVTLTMSGVSPPLISEMLAAENNVKGRSATIYMQFFDENWAPLDAPYAVFLGLMDVMSVKMSAVSATVSLTLESLFTKRGMPPWGWLSAISQQALYPGDNGLNEVVSMQDAEPFWPLF